MAALYIYKKIAGSAHLIALRSCQQSTLGLFILRMRGAVRLDSAKARAAHFQKCEIANSRNVRPSVRPRALDPRLETHDISYRLARTGSNNLPKERGKKYVSMNLMEISSKILYYSAFTS